MAKLSHRGFIHFEVEGLDKLKGELANRVQKLDSIADSAIERGGIVLRDRMRQLCKRGVMYPTGPDGHLADSIECRRVSPRLYKVGPGNLPHARIREYGGVIKAKRAPYLVFQTYDGKWHKCKQVYHPACPYIRPAYAQTSKQIVEIVVSDITEAFR